MGTRGVAGRTTLSGLTQLYTRHETHCAVHAGRREAAHRADPQLDESWWNHRAEPVPVTGQVNLRGLTPLVVVEVLHGLQQRVRGECTTTPVPATSGPGTPPDAGVLAEEPACAAATWACMALITCWALARTLKISPRFRRSW